MTKDEELQSQYIHKYYVRPEHKMDFIEIRDADRFLEIFDDYGLPEDKQNAFLEYIDDVSNTAILDIKNRQVFIFDVDGNILDSFFPIN